MTLHLDIDASNGGRLNSLRTQDGFEWLWSRSDPARFAVAPGDTFIDIGGGEECFPTISGIPDHGEVWSMPWVEDAGWLRVDAPSGTLRRRLVPDGNTARLDYVVEAEPGLSFIWALHALLRPDVGMTIDVPGTPSVQCWSNGDDQPAVLTNWPRPDLGPDLRVLPEDDGSARFVAVQTDEVTLRSPGGERLRIALECDGQPHAIGIWRNLGGYPGPDLVYRSFGIEPMLGTHHHRANASGAELALVPRGGTVSWNVTVAAL